MSEVLCKVCGEEISSDANICPKCGSLLRIINWRTFGRGAASFIKVLAAVATATSIIFMVISQDKTRKQLKQTQEQIELQTQAIDLQKIQLANIDTTLKIMVEQIKTQREANTLQNQTNRLARENIDKDNKQFKEKNKPFINLKSLEAKTKNDSVYLYIIINNSGNQAADKVLSSIVLYDITGIEIGRNIPEEYNVFAPGLDNNKVIIFPWLPISQFKLSEKYIVAMEFRWSWAEYDIPYMQIYYRDLTYDENTKQFHSYGLSKEQLPAILR
jgi:hypothetical protein